MRCEEPEWPAIIMAEKNQDQNDPQYLRVKHMILGQIESGAWPPQHKIPSESALVTQFSVSRMTVNRALRELSIEGVILRVKGAGSFVAVPRLKANILEVRNLADEIAARGGRHSAVVILRDTVNATPDIAARLQVPDGSAVFHSVILHHEDGRPLQIEDRYVNQAVAPDYLAQPLDVVTPNQYLSAIAAWTAAEHEVAAILPAPWEARLLGISGADPCLLVERRTFLGRQVVTAVRLLFAGTRYRIASQQRAHAISEGGG
jgi:GntR family histidine utilization transcriptional repressor